MSPTGMSFAAAFFIGMDAVRRGDKQRAREQFQLAQARLQRGLHAHRLVQAGAGNAERMHQQVLPLLDEDQKRLLEEHRKKMERRGNERRHGGAGNSTNSGAGHNAP